MLKASMFRLFYALFGSACRSDSNFATGWFAYDTLTSLFFEHQFSAYSCVSTPSLPQGVQEQLGVPKYKSFSGGLTPQG
jgi:hypothetical protein